MSLVLNGRKGSKLKSSHLRVYSEDRRWCIALIDTAFFNGTLLPLRFRLQAPEQPCIMPYQRFWMARNPIYSNSLTPYFSVHANCRYTSLLQLTVYDMQFQSHH